LITLANHWLVTYRGGEKVLAEFRRLFPAAPLASLVCKRGDIPEWILGGGEAVVSSSGEFKFKEGNPRKGVPGGGAAAEVQSLESRVQSGVNRPQLSTRNSVVITSPLQWVPLAWKYYKALLPLHPWAFGRLTVPGDTRLVLSSDAAMVKGLRLPEGARQVCYCHSPPRYLWDLQGDYTEGMGWAKRRVFDWTVPRARAFDHAAAQRVDRFIANSRFVAERIRRSYGREATVIYPPVSVDDFSPDRASEDFYLLVTQLTPYKRADLAVRAFTALGKRLVVIGEGTEFAALQKIAGPTVQLLGRQPFKVVKDHFERCRAFLYPQVEDFGITAVEAQAAGKPVIAFRAGGALETVIEGVTGLFFDEQTPEALGDAIKRFEEAFLVQVASSSSSSGRSEPVQVASSSAGNSPSGSVQVASSSSSSGDARLTTQAPVLELELATSTRLACRANAERFRPERFRAEMKAFLETHYPELFAGYRWPAVA
jgi:glycosyltransferase involved in cell wall biosynthesis